MSYKMKTNKQCQRNYIVYRHSIGNEWWLFSIHFFLPILLRLFMTFVLNFIFGSLCFFENNNGNLFVLLSMQPRNVIKSAFVQRFSFLPPFPAASNCYVVTISIWIGTSIYLLFWFHFIPAQSMLHSNEIHIIVVLCQSYSAQRQIHSQLCDM